MAAFGTVKPGFEKAAQLQFPQQFSREYARRQLGLRYAPNDSAPVVQDYVGDDFFADYHAQKRADSQRSVLAGVADTRRSTNRALVSHAGYYGLPETVRHQRRIGSDVGTGVASNIYYGAGISNAQEVSGLEGGVLGSRDGRNWAKNALVKRTAELDAIDAAQAEGPSVQAAVEKGIDPGEIEEAEFNTTLQRFLLTARAGDFDSDTLSLIPRIVKQMTAFFSIPESLSKIDDYRYELVEAGTQLRRNMTGEAMEDQVQRAPIGGVPQQAFTYAIRRRGRVNKLTGGQLGQIFIMKAIEYLDILAAKTQGGVPSPRDMATISRSAAKSVKFSELESAADVEEIKADLLSSRIGRRTVAELAAYMPGRSPQTTFTPSAPSYEDTSGPAIRLPRTDLEDVNQSNFGRQGRPGEFRGERNYFDEDTDRSNWRPGVDVVEEAPRAFSRIVQDQGTDADFKEADEEESEDDIVMAISQGRNVITPANAGMVREAAEELGLASLADIEEAVDEMPANRAQPFLARIANQLLSAAFNRRITRATSRNIPQLKAIINGLLTRAYR
jgi:hypothetical protein